MVTRHNDYMELTVSVHELVADTPPTHIRQVRPPLFSV